MLYIKGHFRSYGPMELRNSKVTQFIRGLLEPFGKTLNLEMRAMAGHLVCVDVLYPDSGDAYQAFKSLDGYPIPGKLACSRKFPRSLHVSLHPSSTASILVDQSHSPPDAKSEPCNPAPESLSCRADLPDLAESPGHTLDEDDVPINSDLLSPAHENLETAGSPMSISDASQSPKALSIDEPVIPEETTVPVQIVKFRIPANCEESFPSFATNRLRFKLRKIRSITGDNQTVLDSSWDSEHLILHVVPNIESSASPPAQNLADPDQSGAPQPQLLVTSSEPTAHQDHVDRSNNCSDPRSVTPSSAGHETSSTISNSTSRHRTWPYDPRPSYLDESIFPDFHKTLGDFLTTFFRLWEESRSDLRCLYDESAVFSNILAKQGRKASAITKRMGWSDIYSSISRLPALTNGPMLDLVNDAYPISLHPPRVICRIHGSFSEFPKNVTRAFDRTLILRPVDIRLHPSEGCLGLLKWIILSDTLTIRKHTTRTIAMVEGFLEKRQVQPVLFERSGSYYEKARTVFQDNLRACQSLRRTQDRPRALSSSSQAVIRSSYSPLSIPISPAPLPISSSTHFTPDHHTTTMTSNIPDLPIQFSSDGAGQSAQGLAGMQHQLRAMQAEIERLKKLARPRSPLVSSTSQMEQEVMISSELPRQPDEECPVNSQPKSLHRDFLIEQQHCEDRERRGPSRPIKVVNSKSYRHAGFGVFKKRLLLPTNLSHYLIVSMKGDIVSCSQEGDHRTKIVLELPGPNPTDIVDSACYSPIAKTLILGSRASSTAKTSQSSSVSLITFRKKSSGSLSCRRIQLEDPIHENGVRATCLMPNELTDPQSSHHSSSSAGHNQRSVGFLTAGHDRFLALWRVNNCTHRRRRRRRKKKNGDDCDDDDDDDDDDEQEESEENEKKITKLYTDHTSMIHTLSISEHRNWVISGGQDGKVFATDLLHSNSQTLIMKDKSQIFDLQMNPSIKDTFVVTTSNKESNSHFQYGDLRTSEPVLKFGAHLRGRIEASHSPVNFYRKGSLRDYFFSYPNGEHGGVLLWDLRFLKPPSWSSSSPSPSSTGRNTTNLGITGLSFYPPAMELLDACHGTGIQTYFESLNSIVVLEKEFLTRAEIRF